MPRQALQERRADANTGRRGAQCPGNAIGIQTQATAVGHQQQVVAPLRRAGGGRLHEQRITRGRASVQREQVGIGGQREQRHGVNVGTCRGRGAAPQWRRTLRRRA
jgi:hypothetical protein